MNVDGYKERIRQNIVLFREMRGMKKSELARLCGVASPTVTNWENGRNSLDVDMLFKVAEILGTTVDVLGGNAGEISTEERDLILRYRNISPEMQNAIRLMAYAQAIQGKGGDQI